MTFSQYHRFNHSGLQELVRDLSVDQEPKYLSCRQVIHTEILLSVQGYIIQDFVTTRLTTLVNVVRANILSRDLDILLSRARESLVTRYLRVSDSDIIRDLSAQAAATIKEFFHLRRTSLFQSLPVEHWILDSRSVLEVM